MYKQLSLFPSLAAPALIVFTLWTTKSNRHGRSGGRKTFYKLCTLFAYVLSSLPIPNTTVVSSEFSKNGYPDVWGIRVLKRWNPSTTTCEYIKTKTKEQYTYLVQFSKNMGTIENLTIPMAFLCAEYYF